MLVWDESISKWQAKRNHKIECNALLTQEFINTLFDQEQNAISLKATKYFNEMNATTQSCDSEFLCYFLQSIWILNVFYFVRILLYRFGALWIVCIEVSEWVTFQKKIK